MYMVGIRYGWLSFFSSPALATEFTGVNCTTRICDELQCLNGGSCEIDHCNCPLGWTGENCSIFDDPCLEVECKNGGECDFNSTATRCVCPSNFTGSDCCQDVNECAVDGVCENGGECFNLHGGYLCLCATGYEGSTCTDLVDHCASSPCQNNGVCENKLNGYECKCSGTHIGLHCEVLLEDTCASEGNQCHFGGQCVEDTLLNLHFCNCSEGYMGDFCLYQYQPCEKAQCNSPGTLECATEDDGVPFCKCKAGFAGPRCETATICASFPCENGGTCHADDMSGFTCTCAPGYTGESCQSLIFSECTGQNLGCVHGACFKILEEEFCKCNAGWGGRDCSIDINECSQSPCQNGGTCKNNFGGYVCTCPAGYDGEDCSEVAGSCNPNPCKNGGSCFPGPSPECICPTGYSGPLCENSGNACLTNMSLCVCFQFFHRKVLGRILLVAILQ